MGARKRIRYVNYVRVCLFNQQHIAFCAFLHERMRLREVLERENFCVFERVAKYNNSSI